jgi:hypothetical protein
MRLGRVGRGWAALLLGTVAMALVWGAPACGGGDRASAAAKKGSSMKITAPFPRIETTWATIRGDRSPMGYAKHDLIMVSVDAIGLEWDKEPSVLSTAFKPESIPVARERVAEWKRLNPNAIVLGDLSFYELNEHALPEDHPWWLRKDGKREQFWPGTYRMDWYNKEYQQSVIAKTIALYHTGVVDGVFYDNLREEQEPWLAVMKAVREVAGDDFLIQANCGYDIGSYDWLAPYMNGVMYESGWSHPARSRWMPDETWDDRIAKMRRTESLLRKPTISFIERFEEVRDHAGWPNDPQKGKERPRDPAARHWTMCYALIVGDFYYLFSDSTSHRHDWYPEYDVKIGFPKAAGERVNAHVWRRQYDKALVVMNLPDATEPYRVTLDKPARDSFTGETGKEFTVPPGDGRVLVWE